MVTIARVILLLLIIVGKDTVLGKRLRIINGHDAAVGEIPYQVSLQFDNFFHFCGAAVLNKNFVITAAHCVNSEKKENFRIVLGSIDIKDHRTIRNATSIYVHEQFGKPRKNSNDIALIKVHPPLHFDELVSPVTLPQEHAIVPAGTKVLMSGWGSIKGKQKEFSLPRVLQKIEVAVIEQDVCKALYRPTYRRIFPSQICTHEVSTKRKGSCVGDSGGPVTLDGVLIGIMSWSTKDPLCASRLYPDVHTRVSEYIDWINEHISE